MIYLEYAELLKKYNDANRDFLDALDKKQELLCMVTPGATKYSEKTSQNTGQGDKKLIEYVSKIEYVDKLITSTRNTRDITNYELKKKEKELRESKDVYDRIYVYKWLEHKSVYKFYRLLNYSKAQIYRKIEEMQKNIYK